MNKKEEKASEVGKSYTRIHEIPKAVNSVSNTYASYFKANFSTHSAVIATAQKELIRCDFGRYIKRLLYRSDYQKFNFAEILPELTL